MDLEVSVAAQDSFVQSVIKGRQYAVQEDCDIV